MFDLVLYIVLLEFFDYLKVLLDILLIFNFEVLKILFSFVKNLLILM